MTRKYLFLLITMIALLSTSILQAQDNSDAYNLLVITHDGLERTAHVYEPDSDIQAVMIALHPFHSSARALEALSGLNTVADERAWVMIYPQSSQSYWDDGRFDAGLPPLNASVDDVGYLASLAETARTTYDVETVYLTGLGNGGTMAIRAVCETPEQYDGLAVVSALMWDYQQAYCDTPDTLTAMNTLFIKGTDDNVYWTEGRNINQQWQILSSEATFSFWANQNQCADIRSTEARRSTLILDDNCASETTTAFLTVINGSNNWMRERGNILNRTGIDTAELIGAFFAGDDNWQDLTTQEDIPLQLPRSYILYVPSTYNPETPTPLVLSLHGRGANHFSQAASSGFNAVAEEHGFIVVYPQAYDPNFNNPSLADAVWNYNLNSPIFTSLPWNDDDFLDAVTDDIASILNIDMNKLYVNGLSNGGYMTHRLACTRGDRYAAFAAVAANAPFGLAQLCQEGVHAPIMLYHGTEDTISPWEGASVTHPETGQNVFLLAPIPNSLAFWVDQNDCGEEFEQVNVPSTDPDSSVTFIRHNNCPNDSAVQIYAVTGGGHVWHGVQDFENDFVGEVNMDLNASEAIWAFYSGYSLDGYDESTAIDYNIGEIIDGEEIVNQAQVEANPQAEFIANLQSGAYTLYLALDLSTEFDCDAETINDSIMIEVDGIVSALNRLEIQVDYALSVDDCRATNLSTEFIDNLTQFEPENLSVILSTLAQDSNFTVIVGDTQTISQEIGQVIPANQTVLIQHNPDNSYQALAIVPMSGWTSLADFYDSP